MKNYVTLFQVILLSLAFVSCTENDLDLDKNATVEIYSLESYSTFGSTVHIDENSVVLKVSPLVEYKDLELYDSKEHFFSFSENGKSMINNLQHSVHGVAFAVMANDELIYTGYFWPGYSSASCDWVTIDPLSIEYGGKGYVNMGYPGPHPGSSILDKRNDPRILEIFRKDGKLIE